MTFVVSLPPSLPSFLHPMVFILSYHILSPRVGVVNLLDKQSFVFKDVFYVEFSCLLPYGIMSLVPGAPCLDCQLVEQSRGITRFSFLGKNTSLLVMPRSVSRCQNCPLYCSIEKIPSHLLSYCLVFWLCSARGLTQGC